MSKTRVSHNLEIPNIARAIEEYKVSYMTQKQCAEKFNIPIKVFSYYFLNGFKKINKIRASGGGTTSVQPTPPIGKHNAKQHEKLIVELLPGNSNHENNESHPAVSPQISLAPIQKSINRTNPIHPANKKKNYSPQSTELDEKMKLATHTKSNGTKKIDLNMFIDS